LPEDVILALKVSRYRLSTRLLDFGGYQELGFSGQVTYEFSRDVPVELARAINALADFAFYGGVGAKTTMGMGQARRRESARFLSD
jgi:CRISPR-associated endoribonuclease Cas6